MLPARRKPVLIREEGVLEYGTEGKEWAASPLIKKESWLGLLKKKGLKPIHNEDKLGIDPAYQRSTL